MGTEQTHEHGEVPKVPLQREPEAVGRAEVTEGGERWMSDEDFSLGMSIYRREENIKELTRRGYARATQPDYGALERATLESRSLDGDIVSGKLGPLMEQFNKERVLYFPQPLDRKYPTHTERWQAEQDAMRATWEKFSALDPADQARWIQRELQLSCVSRDHESRDRLAKVWSETTPTARQEIFAAMVAKRMDRGTLDDVNIGEFEKMAHAN